MPAETYTSPEVFQRERAAIFGREWLLVGHESEMRNPGAYIATDVAGWPIFVIRSRDGAVKGFHNVDFFFDAAADLPGAEKDKAAKATSDVVEEDFPICAIVHRNYAAGVYQSGPLSPKHESGFAYFHDLVRRAALGNQ